MLPAMKPTGPGTARHAKHARIRARIVELNAEIVRGWRHLTAEQRVEAERLITAADVTSLSDFMLAHKPKP